MALFSKNPKITKKDIMVKPLPQHIAIIMDGNGRWAQKKGLPRAAGHRAGIEALKKIVECTLDINIKYLSVYAFSTENWKRPREEINILMDLIVEYIVKEINKLHENGVRINSIGDLNQLPLETCKHIIAAQDKTAGNNNLILNVALNYGGRAEITHAAKEIAKSVSEGQLMVEDINEQIVSQYLYTKNQPDPDLMIRPSGEMRLSNFMLWQLAYSELWITNVLWPDFRPQNLLEAIYDFQNRDRRFGGLNTKDE